MLEINKVNKFFGGLKAVQNASMKVEEGSITGLIGPNGAGKTTLFNTIAGLYAPENGEIYLEDKNIAGLKPHELFKMGVLRTFQIAHEFSSLTVLENLMMVPGNQRGEKLIYALFRDSVVKKQEEENSYSDSFHPKTKDDFVRNLPEDAYYTNLEVYYKITEGYSDDQWNEKKQEIINKRKERAEKKNKAEDDGLSDGDLSTLYPSDNNDLTSLIDTFITNLPDFIDRKTVNKNNQVIESRIPDVLPAIFNFLELVDNSNAISTIGTIEFTDKLAKLNTVATICNDEDETPTMFKELKEKITFEPLYKSPNTNTGGKTMKRNKGGKRKTMKLSKA